MAATKLAKLKIFVKFVIGIVILPAAITGTIWHLQKKGFFNIDNIDVVVENSVNQAAYLQPLVKILDNNLESLRGTSLWNVDIQHVHDTLAQMPWIENISLSRRWPSKLRVTVRAKAVDLVLMTKSGRFMPIAENGESLPSIELKQVPDVAILQGENFETRPELRKRAADLLKEIPAEGAFSKKTISEIHYDDRDGFWLTLVKDGIRVKIGQDQVSLKSARVSHVLEYIESRDLDARVIDANLSKKVLVRLRKRL
jgi:cell division protein FtsQ